MIERVFGWGRQHGRLAHILIQVALQVAFWSLVFSMLSGSGGITAKLYRQDFPILLFGSAVLLIVGLRGRNLPRLPDFLTAPAVGIMAVAVLAVAGAGTWLVFQDYPLTRDEILAEFDAAFLASGRLVGTPPAEWRPYLDALMPQFMLAIPRELGWLSAYLPGNAALRAIGERTIGMEWVNPVLAALAVLALLAIGRRLFPKDRAAAVVAALLAATSAQVLANAMTPYAMTAHLAFNLLWLWAFMRNDRRGDACAIGAGFVATGLHQLIFHPLFVAPFILHLWARGERRRALLYIFAYAAIGLFWACYWQIVLPPGAESGTASATGLSFLVARVAALLANVRIDAPWIMGLNLLRFIAWQNPALIPLAVAAWPAIRGDQGIARPLVGGIVLTIGAMLVLLPWQGLGWGYRYLHGLIGSFCLLAGYGWQTVRSDDGRHFMLAATTAVSLLLVVPLQLWHARDYAAPRARAFALATKTDADVVLIIPAEDLFDDLVRNAPDLSNRPKMMDWRRLNPEQIEALCRSRRVAVFDIRHGALAGLPQSPSEFEISRYSARSERTGCGEPLPLARRSDLRAVVRGEPQP